MVCIIYNNLWYTIIYHILYIMMLYYDDVPSCRYVYYHILILCAVW